MIKIGITSDIIKRKTSKLLNLDQIILDFTGKIWYTHSSK